MNKISNDEIKKAIEEYENDNSYPSSDDSALSGKDGKEELAEIDNSKIDDTTKVKNMKPGNESSLEFKQFIRENRRMIHSFYEKSCKFCGSIMKINPGEKQKAELKEAIEACHFNISPEDTFAFAMLGPVFMMIIGIALTITFLNGDMFFMGFSVLASIGIIIPLTKLPFIFANTERLKTSKEIVICVFYIVTYMRQNSNLEKAIEFAAQHLSGPLAEDLKKVLWDVETQKYDSIKESLDMYIVRWRKTNMEFIETMNLIESSLYESTEETRIALLDKALDVILSETYEKMLHYTHEIQSPITTLHMLGIILPILGLVVLPLVVAFMEGVLWYHIAVLYNFAIPIAVYFIGKQVLSTRPGGYGSGGIEDSNPLVQELKKKDKGFLGIKFSPLFVSASVIIVCLAIGLSPLFIHIALGGGDKDILLFSNPSDGKPGIKFLEYRASKISTTDAEGNSVPVYKGPYGIVPSILSIILIMGLGGGIGLYYKLKTKYVMQIRKDTIELEQEFGSAIFQLGNRLGDGIPLEMCFSRVVEVTGDTAPGKFFNIIDQNVRTIGMSVDQAIFDKRDGALVYYPSSMIESTMKVLSESIKKGPQAAARAMVNVARYVKEMHSVEERLKDLLAEIISSMNSLVKFLAPTISGIVVGITSMITVIIGTLSSALTKFGEGSGESASALGGIKDMFQDGVPTFYFQIVVGVYIVQVVFLVAQTVSGIQNGDDKIGEEAMIGDYLINSTLLYAVICATVMLIFNTVAVSVLGGIVSSDFGAS